MFPLSWRKATLVAIPKPDKDSSNPNNYRPIALTSCLCKTMERMVNKRLTPKVYWPRSSAVFGKKRSTADQLVRFDSFIRNAFAPKEHVIAIFFDLEKAYDTTWKHGILSYLYDLDFRGHLPTFIDGFLFHRLFQVRAGSILSDTYKQECSSGKHLVSDFIIIILY